MSPGPPADNPFAGPEGSTRPRRARSGPLLWLAFVVQRALRLVVMPLVIGLVIAIWRTTPALPWWTTAAVIGGTTVLWLPTTLWIGWVRFIRPPADDFGVLLTSGEVLDRSALRQLYRARAAEVGVMSLGLLALASGFVLRFGAFGVLPLIVVVLFLVWSGWVLRGQLWYAEAVSRFASGDAAGTLAALSQAGPARMRRRSRDAMDALHAQALLRLGDAEGALERMARIAHPTPVMTDVVEAMVRLSQDQRPPAALLGEQDPMLGRALAVGQLHMLDAIYRHDPDAALSELARWRDHRDALPWLQRTTLDLLACAAWQQAGQPQRAKERLRASGVELQDRQWIRDIWPLWWDLLQQAEAG